MKQRKLTCIVCPKGCQMTVSLSDKGEVTEVVGNSCKRGIAYAESECTHPTRTLTSTALCVGGGLVSIKTSSPIPKEMLFAVMEKINSTLAPCDVKIGDVIIENVLDTGADIVATSNKIK